MSPDGGPRDRSGIGGVETIHIGEKNQEVGIDAHRHLCAQPVVVPERRLGAGLTLRSAVLHQLADADAVVLVEHRNGLQLQQSHEGGPQAERPVTVAQIALGQENLGGGQSQLSEGRGVERHQMPLPHRGAGLPEPQRAGTLGQPQLTHSQRHRPAGDQDQFSSLMPKGGHLLHQRHDTAQGQGAPVVGDDLGSQLHHDALGARQRRAGWGLW